VEEDSAAADEDGFAADVADPHQIESLIGRVRGVHGAIGGVIHLLPLRAASSETELSAAEWQRLVDQEVKGFFYLLRYAANDLKSDLSRGRFPLIGATTRIEYERHIEKDPAMVRRFQVIEVPEPNAQDAIAILAGVAPVYARHHGIRYAHDAVVSAVHLSQRFIAVVPE
jgi:NAD(P)-dependent dehydrogenase (short-subunit alcohol dehydrogenase family)